MKFNTYDYRIAGCFASAIINGDYSGLDERAIPLLELFLDNLPEGSGHWSGFDEETANFTRCDICTEYAQTFEAQYHVAIDRGTDYN